MKENDGKGARRTLTHQLMSFGIALLGLIMLIAALYRVEHYDNNDIRGHLGENARLRHHHRRHYNTHGSIPVENWGNRQDTRPATEAKTPQHKHLLGPRRHHDTIQARQAEFDALQQHQHQQVVPEDKDRLDALFRGELALVDISMGELSINPHDGTYTDILGYFCQLEWAGHKQDPSLTPMFRDLVSQSPDCQDRLEVDLTWLVPRLRAHDASGQGTAHTLQLGGVVFHESRCGSTLVANLLQSAHPENHRVFSEATPPNHVLQEGNSRSASSLAPLVRDVFYLMSRSMDPQETHVFFKISSINSRYINVFRESFPDTPWIFVYREPVQVLMSHFAHGPRYMAQANCARSYRSPLSIVKKRLAQKGYTGHQPPYEQYCAAHFAVLTETALTHLQEPDSRGLAIEYPSLPDVMWTHLLPKVWGIALEEDDIQRMQAVAQSYSKGRGHRAGASFEGDNTEKQEAAWPAVQQSANEFLMDSYRQLQSLSIT